MVRLWDEPQSVSWVTFATLALAWLAAVGIVTGLSSRSERDGNTLDWFYPCLHCGSSVAIFQYHCPNCETAFTPPPQAQFFRNVLLMGVAVFYATFGLGVILERINA